MNEHKQMQNILLFHALPFHLLYFHNNVYVVLAFNSTNFYIAIYMCNFYCYICMRNRTQEHMIRGLVDISFG